MQQIFTFSFFFLFSSFLCVAQTDPNVVSGKAKQKAGNHNGAIYDFSLSIKQHNDAVQKYFKALEEFDKIPDAEKGNQAPAVDVGMAIPYLLRGQSYSVMGKNDYAINDFNNAIRINPKMGAAYYERGRILWTVGKQDEGCIDLGIAGSLKDSLATEMFDEKFCWKEAVQNANEAATKLRINDFQGALDKIQSSVRLCPDSARYLGLRGRAYLGLGIIDLAMKDLEKAVMLNQNSVDAFLGRGIAYYMKNKFQESFDDLSKAIDMNSKLADAYLFRAYACEGLEKDQSALFDYQQVQHLKPGNALAYMKSAQLKIKMNDPKGACMDYKKAADLGNSEAQDIYEKCSKAK